MNPNEIVVEHGYPIPVKTRLWSPLFEKMKVGDSFTVNTYHERAAAMMASKRLGYTLMSLKIDGGGYRLWMIEEIKKDSAESSGPSNI